MSQRTTEALGPGVGLPARLSSIHSYLAKRLNFASFCLMIVSILLPTFALVSLAGARWTDLPGGNESNASGRDHMMARWLGGSTGVMREENYYFVGRAQLKWPIFVSP